jgi:hypothetical protein
MSSNWGEVLVNAANILWSQWPIFLVIVICALTVEVLFYFFHKTPQYKYAIRDSMMTRSEFDFYEVLLAAVNNRYFVFPQVHWDNILKYDGSKKEDKFGAFLRIHQKSVDFLLCDLVSAKPLLAIELGDEEADIFEQAGLPLLRIMKSKKYDVAELAREVEDSLPPMNKF